MSLYSAAPRARARTWVAWLLCAVTMAAAGSASARMIHHFVRRGDTLELLAAEYYGNRQNAVYIMAANNMSHPKPLRPGQRLKIPTAWRYTVHKGEGLAQIAERFVGDKRRGPFLAEFSGMPRQSEARPGQEIVIPAHLIYQAQSIETLAAVAATFYGDARKADFLREYNFRSSPQLERGERIVVPVAHVKVREAKLAKVGDVAAEEAAARRATSIRVRAGIEEARRLYRDGLFADVPARLVTLLSEEDPTEEEIAMMQELMAFCYVALGQEELAVRAFREVLARRPNLQLDEAEVSPKIRAQLEEARKSEGAAQR